MRTQRRSRSAVGRVALAAGLFVTCPVSRGIEVQPVEPPAEAAPGPAPGGVTWAGGAPVDADDPAAVEAERAQLEARSEAAERARVEREGEGRQHRALPSSPLLREAVKRQREAARREAARQAASGTSDDEGAPAPAVSPPVTQAPPPAAARPRPDGGTLFLVVGAICAVVAGLAIRRLR